MATSTQTKKAEELLEQAAQMTKAKKTPQAATQEKTVVEQKFANIEGNTFFKIVFDESTTPEQKKAEATKALTYNAEQTKEENLTRLKEFELFKQYVQYERTLLQVEIIKATDPKVFGVLKDVIDNMQGSLLEYEQSLEPLTSIVEALYKLRQAGAETGYDIYKEIKEDQEAEIKRAEDLKAREGTLLNLQSNIDTINRDIAALSQQKKWFGLGGIKQSALEEIARRQVDLTTAAQSVTSVTGEIEALKAPATRDSKFAELAAEKAKLRELLDISSAGHQERQERLINSALNYVSTTSNSVNDVLTHFGKLEANLENLDNANAGMQTTYAILVDATTDASNNTRSTRQGYVAKEGVTESSVEKLTRESKLKSIDDYTKALNSSAVDTSKVFADVVLEANTISTMKTTTHDQIEATMQLSSSGVAGVASRLSGVLTAVNNAAITESQEAARNNIGLMNEKTNYVNLQESIKSAMGLQGVNNSMSKAIDELEMVAKGIKATTSIASEQMKNIAENKKRLEDMARAVQQNMTEARAVNSEVHDAFNEAATNDNKTATAVPAAKKPANPFRKMGNS